MFLKGYEVTKEDAVQEIDYEALGLQPPKEGQIKMVNVTMTPIVINSEMIGAIGYNDLDVQSHLGTNVYDVLVQGIEIAFMPEDDEFFEKLLPSKPNE